MKNVNYYQRTIYTSWLTLGYIEEFHSYQTQIHILLAHSN